jgi:mannosyl-3-phosphoglycerate phosphatase
MASKIIFTDLDGTLVDYESHSYAAALPALRRIGECSVPLVFCSSKTRAEVEEWRTGIGNAHPFIVENGAAIFIPAGYFPDQGQGIERGGYRVIELGEPRGALMEVLRSASVLTGTRILTFHDLSAEEVGQRYGIPHRLAILAVQREYDEPFEILDPYRAPDLLAAIERQDRRWTRSDRFFHITGRNSKAGAVQALSGLYRNHLGPITTYGFGDAMNDVEFLNTVDFPILVKSRHAAEVQAAVPRAVPTGLPGPEGWNQKVLEILG